MSVPSIPDAVARTFNGKRLPDNGKDKNEPGAAIFAATPGASTDCRM